ncbi:MAG: hypothetical protein ACTS5I_10835 [Rhodanobacter sp.]
MNEPTDLDIRIAALQAEYNVQLTIVSNRAAALSAELASAMERLKVIDAAEDAKRKKAEALAEKKRKKAEANV